MINVPLARKHLFLFYFTFPGALQRNIIVGYIKWKLPLHILQSLHQLSHFSLFYLSNSFLSNTLCISFPSMKILLCNFSTVFHTLIYHFHYQWAKTNKKWFDMKDVWHNCMTFILILDSLLFYNGILWTMVETRTSNIGYPPLLINPIKDR